MLDLLFVGGLIWLIADENAKKKARQQAPNTKPAQYSQKNYQKSSRPPSSSYNPPPRSSGYSSSYRHRDTDWDRVGDEDFSYDGYNDYSGFDGAMDRDLGDYL